MYFIGKMEFYRVFFTHYSNTLLRNTIVQFELLQGDNDKLTILISLVQILAHLFELSVTGDNDNISLFSTNIG